MTAAVRIFSVTAGLCLAWAFSLWANSYQEFSRADSLTFTLHLAGALFAEFAVFATLYALAERNILPSFVPMAVNAVFCVFNLDTLVLVHYEQIEILPLAGHCALLAALVTAFYALFAVCRNSTAILTIARTFIVLFIVQTGFSYLWEQHVRKENIARFSEFPAHFTFPEFKKRPNVYLIGFDAMTPYSITKKLVTSRKPPYVSAMEHEGFRILKNVFAERVPTKKSFNSLMAMDMQYFDGIPPSERFLFITGEIPSPLYELFRRNGYKIQVVYKTTYFGQKDKAKIDYYDFTKERGLCSHIDAKYALLGYCLPMFAQQRDWFAEKETREYPQSLFDRILETAQSSDRWLTISHIYYPGHTPINYNPRDPKDVANYRTAFEKSLAPQAAVYMHELVKTIRENDPDGVLIVFGDHGLIVLRGLTKDKLTKEDIFLDRHAIAMGVYPKDFCPEGFEEPYVNIRLGRSLAKCLSGGKDMLPADYQTIDSYREHMYE